MPYDELVELIRGAGKVPVERDSLYQAVRDEFDAVVAEPAMAAVPCPRCRGARGMRLGRIPYINCYPVYGAIDRGRRAAPADARDRRPPPS